MKRRDHTAAGMAFLLVCIAVAFFAYMIVRQGSPAQSQPSANVATAVEGDGNYSEEEAAALERVADDLERAADAATAEVAQGEEASSDTEARSTSGSPALADVIPGPTEQDRYYDISNEPDYMQLIGLDTIAGEGSETSVVVIDLHRKPKFGLMKTWQIDCVRSKMKIVRVAQFEPGKSGADQEVDGEIIQTSASSTSHRIAELACTGSGQLQKSRVHQGRVLDIAGSFWDE